MPIAEPYAETDVVVDDDPYALMEDPDALARAMEPWRYPPKPRLTDLNAESERVKEDHAYRIGMISVMNAWLNGERYGYFPRDKEGIDNGSVTPVRLPDLINEHFDMVMFHAGMDVQITAEGRAAIEEEEIEAKEDYLRLFWDQICDDHGEKHNGGDLKAALADTAGRTGMLAAFVAVDPANSVTGIQFQMLDPFGVYPVFEPGRGLAKVYYLGTATAAEVIGSHGDNGGKLERKVRKIVRADNDEYDPFAEKDIILYWDRQWSAVIWGGELLRVYQHGYGRVPIELELSNLGMQSFMHTPWSTVTTDTDSDRLMVGNEWWQANTRQIDWARKCQPLFWRRLFSHSLKEALATRDVSVYRVNTSAKRPMVVGQTQMSIKDGEPEIKGEEGDVSLVRAEDVVNPYPNEPAAHMVATIRAMVTEATNSAAASTTTSGAQLGGAQASGNAVDILASIGNQRWAPITLMIENFLTKIFRRVLEYARDYPDEMGGDDLDGGLLVPRTKPSIMGFTDPHELTPDIIARTGTRVKVKLHKFNVQTLPPLIQSLMMAKQAGLMSQETGVALIGATDDPRDEARRIVEDQLNAVPELMAAKQLQLGYQRALRAAAAGDMESVRQMMLTNKYLADQLTVAMMARMSMVSRATMEAMQLGAVAPQAGSAMMMPNVNPTGMSDPNVAPYLSPSQFGGTTGQEGGRPAQGQPMPGMQGMGGL